VGGAPRRAGTAFSAQQPERYQPNRTERELQHFPLSLEFLMSSDSPVSPAPDLQASLADLRPYGSLTVCEIKGEKPNLALIAAVDAVQKHFASKSRSVASGWRRSSPTKIGAGLSALSLEWQEERPAAGFKDHRLDRHHSFVVVATDGHNLALSTNVQTAAKWFSSWVASPKQGYVRRVSDRTFRAIAEGKPAVAAWLRNTAPNRSAQFTAVAVTGQDIGESAVAADLTSFLANTVRVKHPVSDERTEGVTVNPGLSKLLSSRPTVSRPGRNSSRWRSRGCDPLSRLAPLMRC
jgi:hypothetical protein